MGSNETTSAPAQRLPLKVDVEYRRSYARRNESGTLKNISLTGAFLQMSDTKELGVEDKIQVSFSVGGRQRDLLAQVIWKNNLGCGVKFQPFNNRDVQIVDDLMYFVEAKRETKKSVLANIFKKVG